MRPAVVVLWGIAWSVRAAIEASHPNYYDPVTLLDGAAVWTYSLVLVLSGLVAWALVRDHRSHRAAAAIGSMAAFGFLAAGVANGLEDAFDISAFGVVYISGWFVGAAGSLLFAVALLTSGARLHAALAVMLALAFVSLASAWLGLAVLIGSGWFAWRLTRIGPAAEADGAPVLVGP